MERVRTDHRDEDRYRILTLACMAFGLIGLLAVIHFWPQFQPDKVGDLFDTRGVPIELEMIEQTQQVAKPPPPPAPLPPVVVPDDEILEFEELELTQEVEVGDADDLAEAVNVGPKIVAQADSGPKPIRFVEPEYTEAARREKLKAEILVEVLIDERGRVIETNIIDRFIFDSKDDPKTPVNRIGYGVEEAAVTAAERWRFRPARHGGRAVQTYYTLTFRFGV